jgi:hypothetical protein
VIFDDRLEDMADGNSTVVREEESERTINTEAVMD